MRLLKARYIRIDLNLGKCVSTSYGSIGLPSLAMIVRLWLSIENFIGQLRIALLIKRNLYLFPSFTKKTWNKRYHIKISKLNILNEIRNRAVNVMYILQWTENVSYLSGRKIFSRVFSAHMTLVCTHSFRETKIFFYSCIAQKRCPSSDPHLKCGALQVPHLPYCCH